MIQTRPASLADIMDILDHLHPEEVRELEVVGLRDTHAQMQALVPDLVDVLTVTASGVPMVLAGVHRVNHNLGRVWILRREGIEQVPGHRIAMVRHARTILNHFDSLGFVALTNLKWRGNAHHLPWLRTLGFRDILETTVGGIPFYEFMRHTK